jgi:hypothetical protein
MGALSDDLNILREMTPDSIHDLLAAEGITGTPGHPRSCPVAEWLTRRHPLLNIHVTGDEISAVEAEGLSLYSAPWSVRDFIISFDRHDYPELIAEEGRMND